MSRKHTIIVLLAAVLALGACKRTPVQDGVAVDDASMGAGGTDGASTSGLGADDGAAGSGFGSGAGGVDGDPLSKRVVYFEYDSSLLTPEAQVIASAHANYVLSNPGVTLVLEGHADERGTREYNLALGEDRAKSVAQFMQAMGVQSGSLRSVSYGEERPVALGSDESSWGLNRRVEILYGN